MFHLRMIEFMLMSKLWEEGKVSEPNFLEFYKTETQEELTASCNQLDVDLQRLVKKQLVFRGSDGFVIPRVTKAEYGARLANAVCRDFFDGSKEAMIDAF